MRAILYASDPIYLGDVLSEEKRRELSLPPMSLLVLRHLDLTAYSVDALEFFVYGTLKRGFRNHDRFCRDLLAVEDAMIGGRLFETPSGIPVLPGIGHSRGSESAGRALRSDCLRPAKIGRAICVITPGLVRRSLAYRQKYLEFSLARDIAPVIISPS